MNISNSLLQTNKKRLPRFLCLLWKRLTNKFHSWDMNQDFFAFVSTMKTFDE